MSKTSSHLKHSLAFMSVASLLWIGSPASAQSMPTQQDQSMPSQQTQSVPAPDNDTSRRELQSFDDFMDGHPVIAAEIRKDPSKVKNEEYVEQHRFETREDGRRFDQQPDGRDRDMTRGQLAGMDRFLDSHPEIAEQLRKNPALVNDSKFVHQHPALQSYLQQHPDVREEFREN